MAMMIKKRIIVSNCRSAAHMASNPQVAGKTFPAVCRASGSMVTGNMIPDMIMDGIKISCVAMPTLDELLLYRPNTMPTLRLTTMSSSKSKNTRSDLLALSRQKGRCCKKDDQAHGKYMYQAGQKVARCQGPKGMLPT